MSAVADAMADAAGELVASLSPDQRELAAWPFPSDDERQRWFYTPTDHGGLTLHQMEAPQQRLVMRLVASGLSRPGYVTVATIMGLENVLDELEGWRAAFDRPRGRDPSMYYVGVFGTPEPGGTWAWRFGGHHVSINHLVVDGEVAASTPCFFGADPASSPLLGPHPLRPLAGAEDNARDLVRALDPAQAAQAIVSPVPPVDLVGANRSRLTDGDLPLPLPAIWRRPFDEPLHSAMEATQQRAEDSVGLRPEHLEAVRYTTAPKGVPATALTAIQRDTLRALLDVYLHRLPDALAEAEAAKYAGDGIGALWFLWAGATAPGEPHYYRVQGPRLVVEYDNTQRGVNHAHAVWRDPVNDFGADVLAAHYRTSHRA
jgi:hypothetical protein